MKHLYDRTSRIVGRFVCCLLILQVCYAGEAHAQTGRPAVGSLHASGEVNLNGVRAAEEQTVFPGDVVHTGPDGAVIVTMPGGGMLNVGAQTEIAFRTDQYLATLQRGTVAIRWLPGAGNLEVRFGNFLLYLPSSGSEAAATLSAGADGGARVECRGGSVGVTAIQGASAVILHAGESAIVTSDGELRKADAIPVLPAAQTPASTPSGRSRRAGYVILGVAAAGGIGAAVALLHKSQPVSPSQP